MKKKLTKKNKATTGTLVAYACSCPCISPGCSCENPMNTLAETRYAMSVVNNIQASTALSTFG